MVKIVHASDFHLDSPFASLPYDKALMRRREMRGMLNGLAVICDRTQADILLIGGDVFDSRSSYAETGEALCEVLSRIRARVFISPGNHDYYSKSSPYGYLRFPKNVHIFDSREIASVIIPELNARVWGGAFISEHDGATLEGFSTGDSGYCEIMVMHGDTGGDSAYSPISEAQIASSGLDYLALGHIHGYSGILRAGNTFYAYPGCTEGRGFDETGEKGVITGTVEKGSCRLGFTPLGGRQYRILKYDASNGIGGIGELLSQYPSDIVRLDITGAEGTVSADTVTDLYGDCVFNLSVNITDTKVRDIWRDSGENTLKGVFLRKMLNMYELAGDEEKAGVRAAAEYGVAALEGREDFPL